MSTNNDELVSSDTSISQSFLPVSANSNLNDSNNINHWGFSKTGNVSDSSWLPVPEVTVGNESSGYLLSSKDTLNIPDGDNIDLYFGINADTNMPSSTYSTTITYTAISESVEDYPTMQDFTLDDCANLAYDTSTTLKDTRNGANYRITRLKDGNCWMTQNLRLDGGITLNSDNTNLPSGTSINVPANIEEGTTSDATSLQIIRNKINETTGEPYDGNLYNWCAATLNNTDCNTTTAEATQDICPKGWTLPSRIGSPSYPNLFGYYNLPAGYSGSGDYTGILESSPLNFVRNGYYSTNYGNQGSYGYYWTRTPGNEGTESDKNNAYNFRYDSTILYTRHYGWRANGIAVRCVQKTAGYMQDFTATDCQNLELEKSTLLVDSRDNKVYRAARLKDGNCWMGDNLAIYDKTLTSADTNLASGSTFTLPSSSNWSNNITNVNYKSYVHVSTSTGYNGSVYYTWCAANALNESDCKTDSQQTFSICPKGWALPKTGSVDTNDTYERLMHIYNITSGEQLLSSKALGYDKYYGSWNFYQVAEVGMGSYSWFVTSSPQSGRDISCHYMQYSRTSLSFITEAKALGVPVRCLRPGS